MLTSPTAPGAEATPDEGPRRNLGALLKHLHLAGPTSRAELAERMNLNRSTIMALTTRLSAAGLVRERQPGGLGRSGRPSLVVTPAADRAYVLAFDVAVDRLTAARVSLGGRVQDRRVAARSRSGPDLDAVVGVLAEFGRELHEAARPEASCVGLGASYCGMIRPGDGTVRYGPYLGWVDQAFGSELRDQLGLGLPVRVGNEAHLGAWAEHLRGAGVGVRNLIYLHGDVGVGGGIIVGGEALDGESGYGSEVGHMVVNPHDGRPCSCGARGCLEAEVGERALLDEAGLPADVIGREAVRDVVEAALRGDPVARRAVDRVGDWLGIGVANLINLFNPGMLVFGGIMRDIYSGARERVDARIGAHVLPVSRPRVRLELAALGEDTTLMGAAELGFADLMANPLRVMSSRA